MSMVTSMAISFHELTIPQQLNVISDALVKETITDAKCSNQFCHPLHPKEPIHVVIGRNKATSSFRSELYKSWGYQKAQALFNNKKIMKSKYFDPFNWDRVHQVMQTTPRCIGFGSANILLVLAAQTDNYLRCTNPYKTSANDLDDGMTSPGVKIQEGQICLPRQSQNLSIG